MRAKMRYGNNHDVARMEFFDKIDYELLRRQKEVLCLALTIRQNAVTRKGIEGLLSLLDSLQDTAVACGMSEEAVFGKDKENGQ